MISLLVGILTDDFFPLKFYLSIQIAGRINKIIRDMGLRDLGQLEQDLVFGDAGAKDVINFLRTKQVTHAEHVV